MASKLLKQASFQDNLYLILVDDNSTYLLVFASHYGDGHWIWVSKPKSYPFEHYEEACSDFYKTVEIYDTIIIVDEEREKIS